MTDRKTVLLVVCFLGAFALLGLAGVVWLVSTGTASDAVAIVSTLTGSALGSIGTLLVSTRSSEPVPTPPPYTGPIPGAHE